MALTKRAVRLATPRKPLDKIQRHPLGGEDRPSRPSNPQHNGTRLQTVAVVGERCDFELRTLFPEGLHGEPHSREHERFSRDQVCLSDGILGDSGERGHISRTHVFVQGRLNGLANLGFGERVHSGHDADKSPKGNCGPSSLGTGRTAGAYPPCDYFRSGLVMKMCWKCPHNSIVQR